MSCFLIVFDSKWEACFSHLLLGTSPPGKPVLLSCRSPEKETFTCWWEPGPDGGLPTTYRLYYERERLDGIHECPDYQSASKNSCFFDKNHTSIWVDYYLTVVAFNDLGNTTSDPLKIDVMDIVKPDPPENVTLLVKDIEDSPHLHISWEPPHNTDTKSGWVTIKYEIRVKQGNNKWKEYMSGTQTHFSLYSISPGVEYTVQVRCRLDHGSWSEWSNTSDVKIPDYLHERPFWIMASTLFIIPLSATLGILVIKRSYLKQCVLPPIPGPKIRGVDFQLLKSGPSDDVINAFNQNFPLMEAWKDQMDDYLIVTENDSGLNRDSFISQERKNSWTFPSSFCLNSDIQCRESRPSLNDQEKAGKTKNENDNFDKSNKSLPEMSLSDMEQTQQHAQKLQGPGLNLITEAKDHSNHKNTIIPFTNSDYVDIQRHDNQQEEDVKQLQYSRVRDTNTDINLILNKGNLLFSSGYMDIQRQEENTSDGYSRVKEVEGDSVVILQKQMRSADPHYKDKANNYIACDFQNQGNLNGASKELNSGYVDATPASLLM
ncbi:prolactin receptor b isoform X1 [Cheilinus undulatus]|uniref:prolactin receptor b isoform X1 n=1 Tax=Cheilinus undulatus TaxID=241271 RepID=UPI001BD65F31|nr:prolactin receptor b isoform X1 [Cheilinus undulatus]